MKKQYIIIGMMSGTSFDGVDLAACHFRWDNKWRYSLLASETISYRAQIIQSILKMQKSNIQYLAFKKEEIFYSKFISAIIKQFIDKFQIKQIDCLAIHGHTIFHNPKQQITVQAANLTTIAALLQLQVIGNFREMDVMRGGQGAPLAPFGEELFEGQIFINFGGVSNIGYKRKGWDVNYCNLLFNLYANKIQNMPFDEGGNLGRRKGKYHQYFHSALKQSWTNRQNHFSLGRQGFQRLIDWINTHFSFIKDEDILTTFYHFLAEQINSQILSIIDQSKQYDGKVEVICTGGGANNSFLLDLLNQQSDKVAYIIPDANIISFKEAIIFAFLGLKYMENIENCSTGIGGSLVKGNLPVIKY